MNRAQKLIQAYRNAPWRHELQVIGLFVVFAAVLALVALVYVYVYSQAGTYGQQTQEIQATSQAVEQNIEDLRSKLGDLTSTERMAEKAEELGLVAVEKERVLYLVVPEYPGKEPLQLASSTTMEEEKTPKLPEEYTQSLFEWLSDMIYQLSLEAAGAQGEGGQ